MNRAASKPQFVQSSFVTPDVNVVERSPKTPRASAHGDTDAIRPLRSVPEPCNVEAQTIPQELKRCSQWVTWRWGELNAKRRYKKVPYNPRTDSYAKTDDSTTWVTFDEAYAAYRERRYDGIGFVLSAPDPYIALDIDNVIQPTSIVSPVGNGPALPPDVEALVTRFSTYTEYSPSGTGLHLILALPSPTGKRSPHTKPVEVYYSEHFITITGRLYRPGFGVIAERADAFVAWKRETIAPAPRQRRSSPSHATRGTPRISDDAVLQAAQQAANGAKFLRLWGGDTSDYLSASEADLALVGILAFYTQNAEQLDRLFRQSKLNRPKWDELHGDQTYGAITIATALRGSKDTAQFAGTHPTGKQGKRRFKSTVYCYGWQQRSETPTERAAYLDAIAQGARDKVAQCFREPTVAALVVKLPPGVGKTYTIAPLGNEYGVAWFALRRDMYADVAARGTYRLIQPCDETNCPEAARLNKAAKLGYAVLPYHQRHKCLYSRQFQGNGSAFYQIAHVSTTFPQRQQGAIVDEFNLADWLEDLTVTCDQLAKTRQSRQWAPLHYEPLKQLLHTTYETMLTASQDGRILYAQGLIAELEQHCTRDLGDLLKEARALDVVEMARPTISTGEHLQEALHHGPVFIPHLVRSLYEDMARWARYHADTRLQATHSASGTPAWNSRLHIDANGVIHIIQPRRFHSRKEAHADASSSSLSAHHWPVVFLDATAEPDIMSLVHGQKVQLESQTVDPPPRMRHIAVRTGSHYGKHALVDGSNAAQTQDRVIRELRFLLERLERQNPDGKHVVGLISYQGCVDVLGEALAVPPERRGHFWGIRGSNALEDCDILVVVGTPTPPLHEIEWQARAIYADDPNPIDTTTRATLQGHEYVDQRLALLAQHYSNAEVTQAAHRNRPLRHDGRVVITLTAGTVDFLPITEEITAFGDLPTQKRIEQREKTNREQEQRLRAAYESIRARNQQVKVRALIAEAHVSTRVAAPWLRCVREQSEK